MAMVMVMVMLMMMMLLEKLRIWWENWERPMVVLLQVLLLLMMMPLVQSQQHIAPTE